MCDTLKTEKYSLGAAGLQGELRPRNQIESLEKELQEAHNQIKFQQEELLNLYRRLYAQDRPGY